MKNNLVVLFLLFSSTAMTQGTRAIVDSADFRNKPLQGGLLFEVGFQKSTYTSLGIIFGSGLGKYRSQSFGFGAAVDLFYNGTVATFGPRAFFSFNGTENVGIRLGAANYLQENNTMNNVRLLLEASYLFGGRLMVYAGLSYAIEPDFDEQLGAFRAGIALNLAR